VIYYRSKLGTVGLPPELVAYTSVGPGCDLHDQTVNDHRVVGITPPFRFDPPADGWVRLDDTWQVVAHGEHNSVAHLRAASPWLVQPIGERWGAPPVLTAAGERAFRVKYGGPTFLPMLTPEQQAALTLAQEVRRAHAVEMPEMGVQAIWAATFLGLIYHLSPTTLGLIGLPEDVITDTLLVAAGLYGQRG
jgi:hypothetical protein